MRRRGEQMILGLFVHPAGHHVAGWRDPAAWTLRRLSEHVALARQAEAAGFDLYFLADFVEVQLESPEAASRKAHNGVYGFEPLTLLSALTATTSTIGLVATASTSFSDPYVLARQYASLDHLSDGRAGWNAVTSADPGAAFNFGHQAPIPHADRYARAEEFVDVVRGLWDSWDDGAFVEDRSNGRFFDPNGLHRLDHAGEHFRVRGPLNIPRPPQGRPIIVQAGSSEPGKALAARTADLVFTAQSSPETAAAFYADLKSRLPAHGRRPDDLKILPGVVPIVAPTREEAQAKLGALQALVDPIVGLDLLRNLSGGDPLPPLDLDGPLPARPPSQTARGRQSLVLDLARREGLSVRQLYQRLAPGRGHWQVVGDPIDVADALEAMFEAYGCDGFNLMPATLPGGLTDFIDLVLPELVRRGRVAPESRATSLRERLGLGRPTWPHGPPVAISAAS
ncbi:nitrilotriacetate monooxygenase [Caulobacter sp. D4A]|uniref:LLM class flavin-dependent oxidoreductase n=1 Tax=unclassified Caulobacter TaxID=2648921 RepID=UPI000D73D501|nr:MULTISPECIES: LLM class flavin-dependent oxidoreductase [unclassified Caulobacter]PXA95103.1 nitrilotriacetate monooxygenase [Caulobacter sp. D5]PXA95695.1 nitrilotriacetate monooxygenase [Caulobacter sp. D4A]